MGSFTSQIRKYCGKREYKIVLAGLDASGKTTLLYKMQKGEIINCWPTMGFNLEPVIYKNYHFSVWDTGAADNIQFKTLSRHYFYNTDILIYFIDSTDRARLQQTVDLFNEYINTDQLQHSILLVLANKQDKHEAMTLNEINDKLEALPLNGRDFCLLGTSIYDDKKINEAFDWIIEKL